MKKIITSKGFFIIVILGLLIFSGCAEKKSVVTSDTGKSQETTKSDQQDLTAQEKNAAQKGADQSVDLEKMAQKASPVSDIHFDFDSSSIRPDARDILKTNADYFMNHKVSSVVIEGHCDERGTSEYNMALGEKRALETKKYLVNLGVKESVMKTVSFGKENPLDPTSTEEAWAKNRRAHFVVNP